MGPRGRYFSSPRHRQEKKDKEWRRIVKALALIEAYPWQGVFDGRKTDKRKLEGTGGGIWKGCLKKPDFFFVGEQLALKQTAKAPWNRPNPKSIDSQPIFFRGEYVSCSECNYDGMYHGTPNNHFFFGYFNGMMLPKYVGMTNGWEIPKPPSIQSNLVVLGRKFYPHLPTTSYLSNAKSQASNSMDEKN